MKRESSDKKANLNADLANANLPTKSDSTTPHKSYIFPLFNRIIHLILIISFAVAFLLSQIDSAIYLHAVFGIVFFVSVILRVIWGFVGTKYSRFSDFNFNGVGAYLRSILGEKLHFIGHNPASNYAIIFMIIIGFLLGISGLIVWGANERQGIFANLYLGDMDDIHEFFAYTLLAIICVHICGALIDKFYNKFDSIDSMISGYKRTIGDKSVRLSRAQKAFCAFTFALIVLLIAYLACPTNLILRSQITPRFAIDSAYSAYQNECASCHIGYAPYLLPRIAWEKMMSDLENHFGDDASFEGEDEVLGFLVRHSSENYANKFRVSLARESSDEMAISNRAFFKLAHQNLQGSIFSAEAIKSKANCNACHENIEMGLWGKSGIDFDKIRTIKARLSAQN